ncbi:hypothetical protein [Actinacidiphila yeochonensis]|uniref:hypothetical protein n=1 Tax=Actinacidiphila yeochonensis TaxID=89050 RepID=UPI0005684575|nr:hypothetical protein [Actinacidiphila yeochonensis]
MTRTPRTAGTAAPAALAAAVALLVLTSGCAAVHQGDVQPTDVEKKADALIERTVAALRPVTGTTKATVYDRRWTRCSTETPGQHRFDYVYGLSLAVPQAKAAAVMRAANAFFAKRGYRVGYSDAPDKRTSADLSKSHESIGLGVQNAGHIAVLYDSDCVFTRHDPKTVK